MSAQILICKFAVFTCVSFSFTGDLRGSLARSLLRAGLREDPLFQPDAS